MTDKPVHYLKHNRRRGVQHLPGALCGFGGWYRNYPGQFTTDKARVTCKECRRKLP